jgi:hypothetical protein
MTKTKKGFVRDPTLIIGAHDNKTSHKYMKSRKNWYLLIIKSISTVLNYCSYITDTYKANELQL